MYAGDSKETQQVEINKVPGLQSFLMGTRFMSIDSFKVIHNEKTMNIPIEPSSTMSNGLLYSKNIIIDKLLIWISISSPFRTFFITVPIHRYRFRRLWRKNLCNFRTYSKANYWKSKSHHAEPHSRATINSPQTIILYPSKTIILNVSQQIALI